MGRHHSSHSSHICTRRLDETLAINPFLVRTPPTSARIPPRRDARRPRPHSQRPDPLVAARELLRAVCGRYSRSAGTRRGRGLGVNGPASPPVPDHGLGRSGRPQAPRQRPPPSCPPRPPPSTFPDHSSPFPATSRPILDASCIANLSSIMVVPSSALPTMMAIAEANTMAFNTSRPVTY